MTDKEKWKVILKIIMKTIKHSAFVLMIMFILTGCTNSTQNDYLEWVSPDGVHYWCLSYRLAPRYDHDGNLVIDE